MLKPGKTSSQASIRVSCLQQLMGDNSSQLLAPLNPHPKRTLTSLSGFADLSPKEIDRTKLVTNSKMLSSWASYKRTCILEAHSESTPDKLMNYLSFVTATMALSLAEMTNAAVLTCFCDKRARSSSMDPAEYGPMSVWNSLNGQLLRFMASEKQTADLAFLEGKRLMTRSQTDSKYARALLKEMLAALPEGTVVFIMIDLFSRIHRRVAEIPKGEELMKELIALTKNTTRVVIKLLVTNALPNCTIGKAANLNLYVPDQIDGWGDGVSLESLNSQKKAMIEKFARQKKKKLVSDSEDNSSTESGSESSESDSE